MAQISIITPAYCDTPEKANWLKECIDSVRQQTLIDWEMIIIDDRSPYPPESIQLEYADDKRVRWFKNAKNYGPAMTRNTAVELSTSECLLPLDADDTLAGPDVLARMYEVWNRDRKKIIYGNLWLSRMTDKNGVFQKFKHIELGQYTFELAMRLDGIMPVTAMHSKECYENTICEIGGEAVYGWKAVLSAGLEDVEYWIAAGKRGFCGLKVDFDTLIYRKQETARSYQLRFVNKNYEVMQRQIRALHPDIYSGRIPEMACGCEGQATSGQTISDPVAISAANQQVSRITTLDDYKDQDLEWVAYTGPKQGRFDILARGPQGLPPSYTILGTGHHFQIHKQHRQLFADRQRLGFQMNVQDPRQRPEPEPAPIVTEQPRPQNIGKAKPQLATIERFDPLAEQTRKPDIQKQLPGLTIDDLGFTGRIQTALQESGLSVQQIAASSLAELSELPGVGPKRGQEIIDKAMALLKNA